MFGSVLSKLSYITVGNAVSSAIGGILLLFLGSILSVHEYGQLSFLLSIGTILSTISIFGLNIAIITIGSKGNTQFVYEATSLTLLISLVVGAIVTVWYWPVGILYIGMLYFIASNAISLSKRAYKEYSFVLIGSKTMQVALVLFLYSSLGVEGIIVGYGLGSLVFSYRYFITIFKNFHPSFSSLRRERNLIFSTSILSFVQSTSASIDKLFIASVFGFTILANYQVGYQFLLFLSLLPASIFQFLLSHESTHFIDRRFKIMLVAISGLISIAFVIAIPMVINQYLPKYEDAVDSIRVMGIGIVPLSIVSIAHSRLLNTSRSRAVVIGESIYIGSQLILLALLGSLFGALGLAFSILISYVIQSLFLVLLLRGESKL